MNINKNKLLLKPHSITEKINRLQHEFIKRNIPLSVEESQNIFSFILGFNDWNELKTILNREEENIQFINNINSLSKKEKEKLVENFINSEDATNLGKLIDYIFEYKPEFFSHWGNSELINILHKIKDKSVLFQENMVSIIKNYLTTHEIDSNNLIEKICKLNINANVLDQIIKKYPFEKHELQIGLIYSCESNKVDFVRYFLLNHEILDINDIFYIGDEPIVFNPLCCAIRMNAIETVKYLLASSELKEQANINIENGSPLMLACKGGNIELVKYLLTSSELKQKANMYSDNNMCVIVACEKDNWDIVNFLLYEMRIKITPNFYKNIASPKISNFFADENKKIRLTQLIQNRDLYFSLNLGMREHKAINSTKAKI